MRIRTLVIVAGSGWLSAGPVLAQVDEAALARLRPGSHVQVAIDEGGPVSGRFATLEDGYVVLESPSRRIRIDSVRGMRVRGRATRQGARIGAVAGAIVGGVLVGAWAVDECGDVCGGLDTVVALAASTGGTLGAGVGGGVGAIGGSALPDGDDIGDTSSLPPAGAGIGSAALDVSFDPTSRSPASAGPGVRVALTAETGPFAPGLEFGRCGLGRRTANPRGPTAEHDEWLAYFAATVTINLGPTRGPVRPYAVVGVGHYWWKGFFDEWPASVESLTGGSLGGGVRVRADNRLSFAVHGRWHGASTASDMSHLMTASARNVFIASAGATWRW